MIYQFENLVGCMKFCEISYLEYVFTIAILFFFDKFRQGFEIPCEKKLIILALKNYKLIAPVWAEAINDINAFWIFGPRIVFPKIFETPASSLHPPTIESFFINPNPKFSFDHSVKQDGYTRFIFVNYTLFRRFRKLGRILVDIELKFSQNLAEISEAQVFKFWVNILHFFFDISVNINLVSVGKFQTA